MITQKRNTILTTALLSIVLLSTTGCIQKQPERVIVQPSPQPQQNQNIGAKTVPYIQRPTIQQIQPQIQQIQPQIQQSQPQTVQHRQAPVQYTEPKIEYVEPPVQYTPPVQTGVQYLQEQPEAYQEQECTDEVSSNCDRGSIDKSQLSNNYSQNSTGGTMHTLQSVQGQTIQIGERSNGFTFPSYPGKVIILEMFGKTCPHCIKEIPTLKKIKRKYGSKVEVVAIHSQGILSATEAKRFIRQHRINYPITDGSKATDLQYFIQNTYGWTGVLPFTMVIKDGQTEGSISGEASYQELREIIDPLF